MRMAGRRLRAVRWLCPLLALAAAQAPGILFAQSGADAADSLDDREPSGTLLAGSLAFVSDYRFRGISNSDLAPAVQASVQLDTASGLFLGLWGSSIADLDGARAEIDVTAGWTGTLGPFDTSAGLIAYLFPAGSGTGVVELFGTAGLVLGPATATIGLNWAPEQANLDRASRYAHATLSAALPGKPLMLRASLGHERNGLPLRRNADATTKWDWQLGADVTLPALTIGVAYVGTDLPGRDRLGTRTNRLGGDGVVVRLSAHF